MRTLMLALSIAITSSSLTSAQVTENSGTTEEQIRRLEQRDADAVLSGDSTNMESSWADDFVVNSPRNRVTKGKAEILKLIRASNIGTYATFVREVESVDGPRERGRRDGHGSRQANQHGGTDRPGRYADAI